VASGGVDRFALSPSGKFGIVVSIEQGDWYYELLELAPAFRQPFINRYMPHWLCDVPTFSPDEEFIVTVGPVGTSSFKWWAPEVEDREEDDEPESPGGRHRLATIYVHHRPTNRVTEHPLLVDVPNGWHPQKRTDDVVGWGWWFVWGPVFTGARSFCLWTPDGMPHELTLPLPAEIVLPTLRPSWQDVVDSV
jgi:hypothetical protein